MSKRKNHSPAFQAKIPLEALKGEQTVAEFASRFGVHPPMIHSWKRALLESSSGVFERGGRKAPQIDEEQVKELHAKIVGRGRERRAFERAAERCGQRFVVTKARAVNLRVRRQTVRPANPQRPIGNQCKLLSISRSSSYYQPKGETAMTLM